ncbi:MAG: tryptophan 7-halogenase [Sphingomonas phyllosphaerae]
MNTRAPLQSVAVAGGGPVALAAAVAFARALPDARVSLIPAPVPEDALADRLPLALPSSHGMLARIGLAPERLTAHGLATRRQASRFLPSGGDRQAWLVGDDAAAVPGPVAPHHLWQRARLSGRRIPPFHALIPGCVAALAGRDDPDGDAALHIDPQGMSRALAGLAQQCGVAVLAPLLAVRHADDDVAALMLEDGSTASADLFVDASGPTPRLVAPGVADAFLPWHDALPCDRLRLAIDRDSGALAGDDYRATAGGWQARWRGLRADGFVAGGSDVAAGAAADAIPIAPGRLARPFAGNVLALGDAAAQAGPLGLAGMTLALAQLDLALELLPARADEPLLRAEYNRRAGLRADRLRDFLGAQYRAAGIAIDRDAPPSLANVLKQFAQRGLLVTADEDSVPRDAWLAVLVGQGLTPRRPDPIATALSPDRAADVVVALARDIAARFPDRIATPS